MKQASGGLTFLLLLLLCCNIVYAKHCGSSRGYGSKECNDNDFCCEHDGEVRCCTAAELWWVWLIISVSFSILVPLLIVTAVLCCVCCCSSKRKNTNMMVIQSPRSIEQSSSNVDASLTIFKQLHSTYTYPDAPPSYSDVSKTVQNLPPPYPGT